MFLISGCAVSRIMNELVGHYICINNVAGQKDHFSNYFKCVCMANCRFDETQVNR